MYPVTRVYVHLVYMHPDVPISSNHGSEGFLSSPTTNFEYLIRVPRILTRGLVISLIAVSGTSRNLPGTYFRVAVRYIPVISPENSRSGFVTRGRSRAPPDRLWHLQRPPWNLNRGERVVPTVSGTSELGLLLPASETCRVLLMST